MFSIVFFFFVVIGWVQGCIGNCLLFYYFFSLILQTRPYDTPTVLPAHAPFGRRVCLHTEVRNVFRHVKWCAAKSSFFRCSTCQVTMSGEAPVDGLMFFLPFLSLAGWKYGSVLDVCAMFNLVPVLLISLLLLFF